MPRELRAGVVLALGSVESGGSIEPGPSPPAAPDPERGAGRLLEVMVAVEAAGFDAVFCRGSASRGEVARDPFVVLGAAAARTSRLALGAIVTAGSRPPGVLAKAVAALDVCSNGRAVHLMAPPEGPGGDPEAVAEELEVSRLMLRVTAPSFEGDRYRLRRAWNEPRADRREPTPVALVVPLLDALATSLLASAARLSDAVVLVPGAGASEAVVERLAAALRALDAAAAASGREPTSIRRLVLLSTGWFSGPAEAADLARRCLELAGGLLLSFEDLTVERLDQLAAWRNLVGWDPAGRS